MFNSTNALVEKVDNLSEKLARAKRDVQTQQELREAEARKYSEDKYADSRAHKATTDTLNDTIARLTKELKEAKADAEKSEEALTAEYNRTIERINDEAEERVDAAEEERNVEVAEAVQDLREAFSLQSAEAIRDHALELAKASKETNAALVRAALAEGKLESIVEANESLEAQLESYKSLVETVMVYLPTVDLAKMHMNVNIPVSKSDVTVVK